MMFERRRVDHTIAGVNTFKEIQETRKDLSISKTDERKSKTNWESYDEILTLVIWVNGSAGYCPLSFLKFLLSLTFHTSYFVQSFLCKPRPRCLLDTGVFMMGFTWWTCHILTEILIEQILKTIFWPG